MFFNFPSIQTTRSDKEQAEKIIEEVNEFLEAEGFRADEELIDILHAVETAIRIRFCGRETQIQAIITGIISKNNNRGYYDSQCY